MRDQETGTANELSGSVYGPSVQAGVIHGDVHIRVGSGHGGDPGPGRVPDDEVRVPWQLPPIVPLTDRTDTLALLERHRADLAEHGHPVLTAVSGLGGVGKTTLALAWLDTLRETYPGGQLYADLGAQSPSGPADPGEVLARFLRDLGVPAEHVPLGTAERTALYRSLTARRRLVVLLDDALTAAQVRPLLPGGNTVTVVTSRWRLTGLALDGCRTVPLEPLAEEAAVELLAATLADGRVHDQPDDARALVDLCAGLPLAVRVAGARLATRPARHLSTMVRALAEERGRLAVLTVADDGDHGVQAALDLTYRELPDDAARLYRLLGLHPGGEFGSGVAAAALGGTGGAWGTYGGETTRLLDLLHDASLLADAGDERHRFHDLVRLHAAAKAAEDERPEDRTAAQRRIADHYLAGATRAEELIDPQHRTMSRTYGPGPLVEPDLAGDGGEPDANTALDWLERELPNTMATLRLAGPAGFPSLAWQLADAMWPLFLRRKHYDAWRTAHEEGLQAARQTGDVEAECRMLTSGGIGELEMDHEAALAKFELAARLFADTGDSLGLARTLNYRGLALKRLGRHPEAAELFARAAERLPACGDARAGALARFNLAELALEDGRSREALVNTRAAHDTLLDAGDVYNAARAAAFVGRTYLAFADEQGEPSQEELHEAEHWLAEALAALRPMSADYETARAVESCARLAELRGRTGQAREHYREAVTRYSAARHLAEAEAARSRMERLRAGSSDDAGGTAGPEDAG
ncbi:putative ATPase [Streptomyces sp. Amel2xB2]|uniref:ATP-binding protein n=1 Tax=Streptomyces sp. Amel2xB2 TaxID=1305829 RepID=UPI000DB918AB|nr:tetratricopeptide repeat protein [Streptomyces sp. Amel2xB2]RAJ62436.1 putative ATPase [Streptomyces sp. Amel2xB2]